VAQLVKVLGNENDPDNQKQDQTGREQQGHPDEVFPVLEELPHEVPLPSPWIGREQIRSTDRHVPRRERLPPPWGALSAIAVARDQAQAGAQ
jgi:hypothetical protein